MREDIRNWWISRSWKVDRFQWIFFATLKCFLSWVNCTLNQKKWATGFWDVIRWTLSFWAKNVYFRLKMAKITSLKCKFLRNVCIVFHDSKCNSLRKESTLMLPKRFIEIFPFFMTWNPPISYILHHNRRGKGITLIKYSKWAVYSLLQVLNTPK